MPTLYEDPCIFRFEDARIITRLHLEGIEPGKRVLVRKIDAATGERLGVLATAIVGDGEWVDVSKPSIVRVSVPMIWAFC